LQGDLNIADQLGERVAWLAFIRAGHAPSLLITAYQPKFAKLLAKGGYIAVEYLLCFSALCFIIDNGRGSN
jgi:hypothetical protein